MIISAKNEERTMRHQSGNGEDFEDCTHDCSSCSSNCSHAQGGGGMDFSEFKKPLMPGASVKKVFAVMSGKGGVGKSMVTALLAKGMQERGYKAAVLDADITGPSIPRLFGLNESAEATESYLFPSISSKGTQVMSMNLLLGYAGEPVVWRGPVLAGVVTQFWSDVLWEEVDYMFVDMPPGTGDVPLTVFQSLPVEGVIIVTTPQELVSDIVEKAVNMTAIVDIPIVALVENMSYFKCPDCGEVHEIFGKSKIKEVSERFDINLSVRLPMDAEFSKLADEGRIEEAVVEEMNPLLDLIEKL